MSEPVGSPPDRARRGTAHDPGVTLARLYSEQLRVTAARISSELGGPSKSAERLDRLFRGLVAQAAPGWFLEVGAYAAETSRWAATELIDCHVVALEASRDAHERLVRRYDFASLGVDYRHAAAASHDGEIELILDGTSAYRGVSLLERRDVHQPRTVTVPSVRLDSVVTDTTANVALWIDVEGASGQVLAGAPRVLSQTDVLKIEVEDAPIWHGQMVTVEVIAQLLGHGLVPVARDIEYGTQYNILALSERLLRTPGVPEQVDAFHYDNAHRWSREPNRLRRSNLRLLGRWARRLRG